MFFTINREFCSSYSETPTYLEIYSLYSLYTLFSLLAPIRRAPAVVPSHRYFRQHVFTVIQCRRWKQRVKYMCEYISSTCTKASHCLISHSFVLKFSCFRTSPTGALPCDRLHLQAQEAEAAPNTLAGTQVLEAHAIYFRSPATGTLQVLDQPAGMGFIYFIYTLRYSQLLKQTFQMLGRQTAGTLCTDSLLFRRWKFIISCPHCGSRGKSGKLGRKWFNSNYSPWSY